MKQPRITVVGDVLLDRYLHGHYTRLNPDGAGRVFLIDYEEERLGGAAAVAMLLRSFGVDAILIGVVGDDHAGRSIIHLAQIRKIQTRLVVERKRITSVKERRVQNGRILPDRTDRESNAPLSPATEKSIAALCAAASCDGVLVSDYAKGCVTTAVLEALGGLSCPMIVDPGRGVHWSRYPARAIIKANLGEAREEAGRLDAEPNELLDALGWNRSVVITAGGDGIYYRDGESRGRAIGLNVPVVDVCGAGDTVLAAIGAALASGAGFAEACERANRAASIQVGHLGVSVIHYREGIQSCL